MFKVPQPAELKPDFERFVYEPRALWSVASVNSAEYEGRPVKLPETHFKNTSKFPVRLTHLLMSPVNYLLKNFEPAVWPPTSESEFDCSGSVIGRCSVRISSPYSYPLSSFVDTHVIGFAPEPTADLIALETQASGLLGISRWDFELPYYIDSKGSLQFDLSTYSAVNGIDTAKADNAIYTSVLWTENAGNQFGGYGRLRPRAQADISPTYAADPSRYYPKSPMALPCDTFAQTISTGDPSVWAPDSMFTPDAYRKQAAARGVSRIPVTGFAVHVDQIDYDDTVAGIAGYASWAATPFAQRLACRARAASGGTGEWWWREGAPLALVCPTLSPAIVKKFDEPIWLGPNESLEVELTTPAPQTINAVEIAPRYNIGLSLVGQAIVEMR